MKLVAVGIPAMLLAASMGLARVGGGDIAFEVKKAGDVVFSHDSHIGVVGPKCTECHDAIFITKEKDRRVTMVQMQKGESCGACHNGKKAFDVKVNCSNCHEK